MLQVFFLFGENSFRKRFRKKNVDGTYTKTKGISQLSFHAPKVKFCPETKIKFVSLKNYAAHRQTLHGRKNQQRKNFYFFSHENTRD